MATIVLTVTDVASPGADHVSVNVKSDPDNLGDVTDQDMTTAQIVALLMLGAVGSAVHMDEKLLN